MVNPVQSPIISGIGSNANKNWCQRDAGMLAREEIICNEDNEYAVCEKGMICAAEVRPMDHSQPTYRLFRRKEATAQRAASRCLEHVARRRRSIALIDKNQAASRQSTPEPGAGKGAVEESAKGGQNSRPFKSLQRRKAYRVRVAPDSDLQARAWIIPETAKLSEIPSGTREIKVELKDVSVGGLGVRLCPKGNDPLRLTSGQRLRVELIYGNERFLLDGTLRHPSNERSEASNAHAGIILTSMNADIVGRRRLTALTRIVGQLQREELRRAKLGLNAEDGESE
jgi:hypothetical protein